MRWYQDMWRVAQWITLATLATWLIARLRFKLGLWITAAIALQLWHGLHIVYFGYPDEPKFMFHFSKVAAEATLWLLVASQAVIRINAVHWFGIKAGFAALGLLLAYVMIGTKTFMGTMYGIVPSAAANAALVACCVPLALSIKEWRLRMHAAITMAAAALLAGGSTGIAALALGVTPYLLSLRLPWRRLAILGALAAVAALILIPPTDRIDFFSSRGRFNEWALIFKQYSEATPLRALFGFGPGSFEWLHPIYQLKNTTPTQYFLWAHNEWLQVLFENGFIGFAALMFTALKVLDGLKTPELKGLALAYGVTMLTTNPMRSAPFQILGAALIAMTCRHDTRVDQDPLRDAS